MVFRLVFTVRITLTEAGIEPARLARKFFASRKKFGGGRPNLLEQQELTASITRKAAWVKGYVDLAELAKLRQLHKLTIKEMATHFGVGASTLKLRLRELTHQ